MLIESLAGKTIVVTGAASGIGKRTSELLKTIGAHVIALDRKQPEHDVEKFVEVNLADPKSIDAGISHLHGVPIHGLCNIAGVPGTFPDQVVAGVNYLGLRHLTIGLLPQLTRGSGIVNIASVAGMKWRDHADRYVELAKLEKWAEAEAWMKTQEFLKVESYRRYKEALVVWSQTFAGEWMQRYGVRMNCVSPGPVDTPILDDFRASLGQKNVADLIEMTGRPGTPDDIAPLVVFLLTESARWVVGVDITVDGGLNSTRFAAEYRSTVNGNSKS